MAGPLSGVRIVELTFVEQGPFCGQLLGDLGADVIKIEPRITGDIARGMGRISSELTGLKGRNYYFEVLNRNKRGITLDLRKDKGLEIFFRLVDRADVFLTNLRMGVPERMGIGYQVLHARNPRLIYAHASGWGRKGPDATEPSFDYTGIARSGTMMMVGEHGTPPQNLLPGFGDQSGGVMCAFGVVAALYDREKRGEGQLLDTSIMSGLMAIEAVYLSSTAIFGHEFPRQIRAKAGNPLYNHYKCGDGKWIALGHIQSGRYWHNICQALGLEDLEHDPRFSSFELFDNDIEARRKNAEELISILDKKFATKTRDEWVEIFKRERLICTPVQTLTEVINDPQAIANDYVIWFDHPVFGKIKMFGFPWSFSETPASVRREAPELGQHTEEVLLELGYTWDDIVKLKDEEVI